MVDKEVKKAKVIDQHVVHNIRYKNLDDMLFGKKI